MNYVKPVSAINNHEIHGLNLGLSHSATQSTKLDSYSIAYLEEKTLCEFTGIGVIQNIWLTFAEEHVSRAAQLRVYVDGELTPSLDIDMGTLGTAMFLSGSWKAGWCKHAWSARSSATSPTGVVFRYPIPYSDGVRITIYNPVNYTSVMSGQIFNTPDLYMPIRLKANCVPYSNPVSLGTPYQHINLTDTEGWLLMHALALNGTNNNLPLESNMSIWIDGESTASIESTGFEDFFDDSWYFGGRSLSIPWRMMGMIDNAAYNYMMAIDFMEMFGGLYFNNAVRTQTEAYDVGIFSYAWLWYQTLRGPQ